MTSTTATNSSRQPDIDVATPQFRRSAAPEDPFLGRLSPGPFSADMSPAYLEHPQPAFSSSALSIPSITIPQHPPPVLQGTPLLDDRESLAYSDFLDKLALDSDFIFDPVLPETLPTWPFPSSTASPPPIPGTDFPPIPHNSPSAEMRTRAGPPFANGKTKSKSVAESTPSWSADHHPQTASTMQLPLLPTAEIVGPPLTLDTIRSGHITAEERAILLRAAHRQQGLAWGSDPRFSKSGFKLNPEHTDAQSNAGQNHRRGHSASESDHVAASEILRQMSQDGGLWHSDRTDEKPQSMQHGIPPSVLHSQQGGIPIKSSSSSISSSASPIAVSPDALGTQRKRASASLSPVLTASSIKSDTPTPGQQKRARKASPLYVDSSSNQNRELLTEAQRRKNHISSEKKRRDIIKQGFDELSHLVPVLRAGGFSKSTVLGHVVDYLMDLERKNQGLKTIVEKLEKER
ncbi:hypothetical protein V1506DRAFT_542489 [Lipomyces tetrasporus]